MQRTGTAAPGRSACAGRRGCVCGSAFAATAAIPFHKRIADVCVAFCNQTTAGIAHAFFGSAGTDARSAAATLSGHHAGTDAPGCANRLETLLDKQRSAYAITDLRTQRIGLEGETRLCAEFRSAKDAQAALSEIRQRAAGVELLDVSDAPCPSPKESKP